VPLDDLQGRGLARPIGAEQGVQLPASDLEGEVRDRAEVPVVDGESVDVDDGG
jgi:hypothetical protein